MPFIYDSYSSSPPSSFSSRTSSLSSVGPVTSSYYTRPEKTTMFNSLRSKLGSRREPSRRPAPAAKMSSNHNASPILPRTPSNPFARTTPTRRPQSEQPPPYSPPANETVVPGPMQTTSDSPYAFLTQFDTVFLVDDSGSMAGRSWRETSKALQAITPICTTHDKDGIDVYFLNHRGPGLNGGYTNITTTEMVENIFSSVRPLGGTPTGTRLNQILKPYVEDVVKMMKSPANPAIRPLNIIVITDGVPSDDVESVIVRAAKKLDDCSAEPWQVGIQFFQVGNEPEAAEDLRELDDALAELRGVRDIVDTVPFTSDSGSELSADCLLKVVLGSVNRRLDRKQVK